MLAGQQLLHIINLQCSDEDVAEDGAQVMRRVVKPVTTLGRQPKSDVFVLGPNLHIVYDGEIPPDKQMHVWIPSIMQKLRVPGFQAAAMDSLPHVSHRNPLKQHIEATSSILGRNLMSGLFMLGKRFVCTHQVYTAVMLECMHGNFNILHVVHVY